MKRLQQIQVLLLTLFIVNTAVLGTARLQVIHNAADPAAAKVDIYLNETKLLDDFAFRTATPFIDAPSGVEIKIGVAPATSTGSSDIIATIPVTLVDNSTNIAIANGVLTPASFAANPDGKSTAFQLILKGDAREAAANKDNVEFSVLHGSTDAPAVDVYARGAGKIVAGAVYSAITDYISVPPALYTLDIKPKDNDQVLVATFKGDLSGLKGGAAVVFASGFLSPAANGNGKAFGLFAALANGTVVELGAATTARLQVIHNAADPGAASVDIYLNDAKLLDNFAFRAATPFIDAPANQKIKVSVAGPNSNSSSEALANFEFNLTPAETYIAIANGVLDPTKFAANPEKRSTAFNILVKAAAQEKAADAAKVDFSVLHGATDAPAVDVIAKGVAKLVDGAAYGDITKYISVPAASYILNVTPKGAPQTVVASFQADLSTLGGGAAFVFASGFLTPASNQNGKAFGLYAALANGTVIELPVSTPIVTRLNQQNSQTWFRVNGNGRGSGASVQGITYSLGKAGLVELSLYNVTGRKIAQLENGFKNSGQHFSSLNRYNLGTGQYIIRFRSAELQKSQKIYFVR